MNTAMVWKRVFHNNIIPSIVMFLLITHFHSASEMLVFFFLIISILNYINCYFFLDKSYQSHSLKQATQMKAPVGILFAVCPKIY